MIIDKELELSDEQAVTASAASTNYINTGVARRIGVSDKTQVCITCTETAASAGASTVVFSLESDDNSGFSSASTVVSSAAVAKADLVAGYQIFLDLPSSFNEQYLRAYFTVAVANLTAGKFSVAFVEDKQINHSYPDA